jgi:hypothetical protein
VDVRDGTPCLPAQPSRRRHPGEGASAALRPAAGPRAAPRGTRGTGRHQGYLPHPARTGREPPDLRLGPRSRARCAGSSTPRAGNGSSSPRSRFSSSRCSCRYLGMPSSSVTPASTKLNNNSHSTKNAPVEKITRLHNPADIRRRDLRLGDHVMVHRTGDVIPRVEAPSPTCAPTTSSPSSSPRRARAAGPASTPASSAGAARTDATATWVLARHQYDAVGYTASANAVRTPPCDRRGGGLRRRRGAQEAISCGSVGLWPWWGSLCCWCRIRCGGCPSEWCQRRRRGLRAVAGGGRATVSCWPRLFSWPRRAARGSGCRRRRPGRPGQRHTAGSPARARAHGAGAGR